MKLFFILYLFILFAFSACSGERNIDIEDRERRLGLQKGSEEPPSEIPTPTLRFISMNTPEMFNEKMMVVHFNANISNDFMYFFSLYFDLEKGKIFAIGKNFDFLEVGQFQCVRSQNLCLSFDFKSNLKHIDKITEQMKLNPAIKNSNFRFFYKIQPEKYRLSEIVNDIPNEIETANSVEMSVFVNQNQVRSNFILFQERLDQSTSFYYQTDQITMNGRFSYKHLEKPWVLERVNQSQEGQELKINFIFFNPTDLSTTETKYTIKNVQN